jgi:predicted secreted Zn-dependent protease
MVAKWVIGACLAVLSAAPVLGEEGKTSGNIQVSKLIEQSEPLPRQDEPLTQVKVKEDYQYYDIDGASADELRAKMKQNGTTWNDGKVYAALTTWDIRYHYDITHQDGQYTLNAIKTDVDIAFHLPRLMHSSKTPEQLAASWDSYYGNLKTHELGHRDIAVRFGREIYQGLSSIGATTTRSELDEKIKDLLREKFSELKQAQIAYDQETHHGKLQGAVLHDPMVAGVPAH